jgi:hypothetical protein
LNQSVKPESVESSTPLQKEDLIGVKHVDGWVKIEKGYIENTVIVYIKPRGKYWCSVDYHNEIESAFEVKSYEVEMIGAIKVFRTITLVFRVEGVRLVE